MDAAQAWLNVVGWATGMCLVALVLWCLGALLSGPWPDSEAPKAESFDDHWSRYVDHRSELLRQHECGALGDEAASRSAGSERG